MDFQTAAVTGATGHLGSVLVRELLRRGKRVRAPGDCGKAKAAASQIVLDAVREGLDAVIVNPVYVLGHAPRPVEQSLRDAWAWMMNDPDSPRNRPIPPSRPGRA